MMINSLSLAYEEDVEELKWRLALLQEENKIGEKKAFVYRQFHFGGSCCVMPLDTAISDKESCEDPTTHVLGIYTEKFIFRRIKKLTRWGGLYYFLTKKIAAVYRLVTYGKPKSLAEVMVPFTNPVIPLRRLPAPISETTDLGTLVHALATLKMENEIRPGNVYTVKFSSGNIISYLSDIAEQQMPQLPNSYVIRQDNIEDIEHRIRELGYKFPPL